jgi:hypothetical protein
VLHGEGTQKFDEKFIRENKGNFYGGFLNGKGVQTYSNGAVYEGYLILNKRHGRGKMIWQNGESYEGNFFGGVKHGFGVQKWPSGDMYEGNWVNNRMHGFGVLSLNNGEKIEGDWMNGIISSEIQDEEEDGMSSEGEGNSELDEDTISFEWSMGEPFKDNVNQGKYRLSAMKSEDHMFISALNYCKRDR